MHKSCATYFSHPIYNDWAILLGTRQVVRYAIYRKLALVGKNRNPADPNKILSETFMPCDNQEILCKHSGTSQPANMNIHNLTNILTNNLTAVLYITCVKKVNMAIACKSASVKHLFMQATLWAASDANKRKSWLLATFL